MLAVLARRKARLLVKTMEGDTALHLAVSSSHLRYPLALMLYDQRLIQDLEKADIPKTIVLSP